MLFSGWGKQDGNNILVHGSEPSEYSGVTCSYRLSAKRHGLLCFCKANCLNILLGLLSVASET